jgi:hypothetical protein
MICTVYLLESWAKMIFIKGNLKMLCFLLFASRVKFVVLKIWISVSHAVPLTHIRCCDISSLRCMFQIILAHIAELVRGLICQYALQL